MVCGACGTANLPTRLVCLTKFSEKSFQIAGSKFWNKIPEDIRQSDSLTIFKRSFKNLLLESEGNNDDSLFVP